MSTVFEVDQQTNVIADDRKPEHACRDSVLSWTFNYPLICFAIAETGITEQWVPALSYSAKVRGPPWWCTQSLSTREIEREQVLIKSVIFQFPWTSPPTYINWSKEGAVALACLRRIQCYPLQNYCTPCTLGYVSAYPMNQLEDQVHDTSFWDHSATDLWH